MRTILICPDDDQRIQLEQVLKDSPGVELCTTLEVCPDPDAFSRLAHAWVPDIVFLSIAASGAEDLNQKLATQFPKVRRVALYPSESPDAFRRVIHWGMQELITLPLNHATIAGLLARVARDLEANPRREAPKGRVIAFVPAKAGAGASTIAANLTWAMAKTPDARVLLADFDSQSGMAGFLFGVEHEFGMDDAFKNAKHIDAEFWHRLVKPASPQIDLLLSGRPRLGDADDPSRVPAVIEQARHHYTVVNVDIPDSWDSVALTVLREADQIFVVSTPELSSLRLARSKTALMRKLNIAGKAAVILNRSDKAELNSGEIESVVGLPLRAFVPNDYQDVTESIRKARASAALAKSLKTLAAEILNQKAPEQKRGRFLEDYVLNALGFGFRRAEPKEAPSSDPLRVTP